MKSSLVTLAFAATAFLAQANSHTPLNFHGVTAVSPVRKAEAAPGYVLRFPSYGSIERLSSDLDALLAPDAQMEKLADGFRWSEGPTWLKRERALVFSDVPENKVYRWSEKDGKSLYLSPSGHTGVGAGFAEPGSNGLITDRGGRLILCQDGDRRISRLVKRDGVTGTYEPLVEFFGGRRFNSPNDVVYDREGNLYFTDPPYGLEGKNQSPLKELMFNGVFLLRRNGELELLTSRMTFPNGIGLSPDGHTLYVSQSDPDAPVVMAYDVKSDGTIGNGRLFFDAKSLVRPDRFGMPDGMKLDIHGNLWCTGPGGVLIINPEGKLLGTLLTGQPTGNCAWGDDGTTLYITSNHDLVRIRTRSRGLGF
jgi:gluconolactonase